MKGEVGSQIIKLTLQHDEVDKRQSRSMVIRQTDRKACRQTGRVTDCQQVKTDSVYVWGGGGGG